MFGDFKISPLLQTHPLDPSFQKGSFLTSWVHFYLSSLKIKPEKAALLSLWDASFPHCIGPFLNIRPLFVCVLM